MTALFIVWAGLTIVFVLLLIYRGTLTMHEDDQLFLDQANSHLAKEQEELTASMNRIQPLVWLSGVGSVALILVMAGIKVYSQINRPLP
jgi:hypothetical protein